MSKCKDCNGVGLDNCNTCKSALCTQHLVRCRKCEGWLCKKCDVEDSCNKCKGIETNVSRIKEEETKETTKKLDLQREILNKYRRRLEDDETERTEWDISLRGFFAVFKWVVLFVMIGGFGIFAINTFQGFVFTAVDNNNTSTLQDAQIETDPTQIIFDYMPQLIMIAVGFIFLNMVFRFITI